MDNFSSNAEAVSQVIGSRSSLFCCCFCFLGIVDFHVVRCYRGIAALNCIRVSFIALMVTTRLYFFTTHIVIALIEEFLFKMSSVRKCMCSKRFRSNKFGEEAQQWRSKLLEQHPVSLSLHCRWLNGVHYVLLSLKCFDAGWSIQ